jgi:hypothetical protein
MQEKQEKQEQPEEKGAREEGMWYSCPYQPVEQQALEADHKKQAGRLLVLLRQQVQPQLAAGTQQHAKSTSSKAPAYQLPPQVFGFPDPAPPTIPILAPIKYELDQELKLHKRQMQMQKGRGHGRARAAERQLSDYLHAPATCSKGWATGRVSRAIKVPRRFDNSPEELGPQLGGGNSSKAKSKKA